MMVVQAHFLNSWETEKNLACNSNGTGVCSSYFIDHANGFQQFSAVLIVDSGSSFAGWGAGSCDATRSLINIQGVFQGY